MIFAALDRFFAEGPQIERVRHEARIRSVEVQDFHKVTPGMLRVTFSGDELADFTGLSPDDHSKLIIPGAEGGEHQRRNYTPRPKGSAVMMSDIRRWLLIGDETALPAIGRRIEEASENCFVTSIVAVQSSDEHQAFESKATLDARWVHRPSAQANSADNILELLRSVSIHPQTYFGSPRRQK